MTLSIFVITLPVTPLMFGFGLLRNNDSKYIYVRELIVMYILLDEVINVNEVWLYDNVLF